MITTPQPMPGAPTLVRAGRGAWRTDRGSRVLFAPRRVAVTWFTLPYGVWTLPDGSEIAFNRDYIPLFVRHADGRVCAADRTWWVQFVAQRWLYCDASPEVEKRKAALALLRDWGVDEPLMAQR